MQNYGATVARLRMRHLRLIDVLARSGSMHRAAKELHLSQPAASKLLQDLEELLDRSLFTRSARGMVINEFGQYVLAYARRMLNETNRFQDGLDNMKVGGFGTLSIGAILDPSPKILPRAIAALVTRRPLIRIHVEEGSSAGLLRALEQNQHDLVIARYTSDDHAFEFDMIPLHEEPLIIFTARSHPLAGRAAIDPEETLAYPWVVPPADTPTRQTFSRAFTAVGLRAPIVVETGSFLMTLHLVEAMGAISVLPRDIIEDRLKDGSFSALPIELGVTLPAFGIITRKGTDLSENAALFVDLIKELAREGMPARGS